MSRRPTLAQLRRRLLEELDDTWQTPSELCDRLGLGHGIEFFMTALVLERLAADGEAELHGRGLRVRKFRRAR